MGPSRTAFFTFALVAPGATSLEIHAPAGAETIVETLFGAAA